jgi:signal transduction histidine kinase
MAISVGGGGGGHIGEKKGSAALERMMPNVGDRSTIVQKDEPPRRRSSAGRVTCAGGTVMVACVEWLTGRLSLRGLQGRDTAAAVIFAVLYFAGMWLSLEHGWLPASHNLTRFKLAGLWIVAVLLVRERLPLSTLLATTVLYPMMYGTYLRVEFHPLPIYLAAYTAAAQGRLRTIWILVLACGAVTQMLIPFRELITLTDDWNTFGWLDPSRFSLVEALTPMIVLLGRASFRQKQVAAQLLARNRELERLRSVETDQVISAERTRIARELHDIVAHHISAMVIRAQAADRVADSKPGEMREAVRWIAASGQETLAAMRHVVRMLRSSETGGGLAPQTTLAELPEIAERMAAVGLPVELRLPPVVPVLPTAVELATVRIIQEALTNVLVHADATRALVELSLSGDRIRLEVHDDGSAASPPTVPIRMLAAVVAVTGAARPAEQTLPRSASMLGGNGLIGMRERAASCGGALSIGTSPLGGWLVSATLRVSLPGRVGPEVSE